jgi:hypothetical protein
MVTLSYDAQASEKVQETVRENQDGKAAVAAETGVCFSAAIIPGCVVGSVHGSGALSSLVQTRPCSWLAPP